MSTSCSRGHEYVEGSFETRPLPNGRLERRVCTACRLTQKAVAMGLISDSDFQGGADLLYERLTNASV